MPTNKKVAFLVANDGIEQIELTSPWQAVKDAGLTPVLISINPGTVQAYAGYQPKDTFPVDALVKDVAVADYAGIVLPGGVGNPDELRLDQNALDFVKGILDAGKPVASICHAAWVLAEANVISGRKVTSWKSVKTDLINAGGEWSDIELIVDTNGPGTLITSRSPDDLAVFNKSIVEHMQK